MPRATRSQVGVGAQIGVDVALVSRVVDLERHDLALRKARLAVLIDHLVLEPAHRDLADRLRVRLDAACEAVWVKQLEQRGERVRVAVVRRCREKEAVLAVRRELADRLGSKGVRRVTLARSGRRNVMDLVDDQHVEAARDLRRRR